MHRLAFVPRPRRLVAAVGALTLALVLTGVALAAAGPAIQTLTPKSASQITNIDVLRQQIKNYYGAPLASSGANGTWAAPLNLASNYAHEAASVAAAGERWLAAQAHVPSGSKVKAIVLDVDDTTLATWNYELYSNWGYNPTTNATFVNGELFPAVPGMVKMVNDAAKMGYAVIFLTGRPATQYDATLGNLTDSDTVGIDAGYPTPAALYTKPAVANYPDYLKAACATEIAAGSSCTTDHYKAATRAHIESLGYDIVANFGDQYSDFSGGFEDRTFKLPNPNYFLP